MSPAPELPPDNASDSPAPAPKSVRQRWPHSFLSQSQAALAPVPSQNHFAADKPWPEDNAPSTIPDRPPLPALAALAPRQRRCAAVALVPARSAPEHCAAPGCSRRRDTSPPAPYLFSQNTNSPAENSLRSSKDPPCKPYRASFVLHRTWRILAPPNHAAYSCALWKAFPSYSPRPDQPPRDPSLKPPPYGWS